MAEYHNIKWQRKDYSALIKAVNRYNKRIKELEKLDFDVNLPDVINYKDIKKDIYTRSDLNQKIRELSRIKFKNALDIMRLDNGQLMTRFEYNLLNKYAKRGTLYLEQKLEEEAKKVNFKGLRNDEMIRLEASLNTLKNWQRKTDPQAFKYAKERIMTIGSTGYERGKAENYRKNFMKIFNTNFKNYIGYNAFKKKLDSIKDAKAFYEYIKKSDFLMDAFTIYYIDSSYSSNENYIYGSYDTNEQAFINALQNDYNLLNG